ncbi:hypothetical protein KUTeg_012444 [Tegillarca granosa]|uniref:Uncharacterized protein n=1 Tax=Tegillarca granosa TaxID=220873 RepID=A0ABQ9EZI9_TEGGR|nr:hypothetical protein KUTeg_012444 [Tegillarca granosa]
MSSNYLRSRSDVAVFCLKSGRVEVNAKDNAGYTPLHECSVSGHMGIARLLLSYGANVNCSSQDGIRFEKCALLRDVTDYYKVNSVAIEKTSGVKSSLNISKDQLLNKSLDFMLCDRILSIPGSSCRLLKSQELMQIIQKCERRNVRKYVRKSKPFENGQNSNCSESSPVKKRKYCKKSSLDSLHVNDSRQTIEPEVITDGAHGLNSLHERETTHKTQELLSNDTFTACKKMADNNNTTDIDFMSVEEGIHLGASPTPDSDPEDEFDFSSFLNF